MSAPASPRDPRVTDALVARFGARVLANAPLAPFTTFRVGGPADWLIDTRSADEILDALRIADSCSIPVTLLGGGSNVLVADAGVRGLVIRPRGGAIVLDEGDVRADGAVTINALVRWTVARGLAGLEAWAGTPGTVGGGVHGNAHFRGRLLGDLVVRVCVASRRGDTTILPAADMAFGYDRSRLQATRDVVLWAAFHVTRGDPDVLRKTARESLAFRKRTQPLNQPSAGCIFQNPEASAPLPAGVPRSAGALIDRAGLKGAAEGGARVSPVHANFIVNDASATAADIRRLIERCRRAVAERFGITLREEIVYLGEF